MVASTATEASRANSAEQNFILEHDRSKNRADPIRAHQGLSDVKPAQMAACHWTSAEPMKTDHEFLLGKTRVKSENIREGRIDMYQTTVQVWQAVKAFSPNIFLRF